ncbi:MAG: hypothetical protein A3C06_00190 [Candidatus Taylorbacteria bacterium RIFCSPHIGHO2_02_FULL_46_13]|uniref:Trigger factor n=1 Tax=Candidatus Taylorbacteria bacterium RIFCSPHIGHO2_02_FULL_46_13 TaxID=1802312 RepID=A0A1G2MUT9_9BACT|nr:MAG: hypothetical protein A3C06_00190 [Candidatus Taylorbacteria bacterium RIFCSPHIGHO2_02_FULL_46_13]
MSKHTYTIVSEKDLAKSTKEFEVEIPAEVVDGECANTLRKLAAETELPGFRKGKAPEALVLNKIGEMAVLEKAADELINQVAFSVLAEKKLSFIGQPAISVTVLAPKNPLRFKMTVALVPEISLPDYKNIAATENKKVAPPIEVTEEEMKESLIQIKKILAQQSGKEKEAPELTDESVKLLGNFGTLAEFMDKLKKDLHADKKTRAREKKLLEIIEKILTEVKVEIPDALVEHEIDRIEAEFMHDVERMGTKPEDYLKSISKTKEQLREGWRAQALKRATFELLLPRIASAESLTVPTEDVEREAKHLLEHYQGTDKEAAKLYVGRSLLRQKVLDFLEKQ